ncbi:unnamed protein product, partial [Mesorhabditis belari]|uniref:Uncharacterized protein n=1 Tax=Mesorhabditis belari TaxID=2138241 RepID=A0AAF3EQN6_9BILA
MDLNRFISEDVSAEFLKKYCEQIQQICMNMPEDVEIVKIVNDHMSSKLVIRDEWGEGVAIGVCLNEARFEFTSGIRIYLPVDSYKMATRFVIKFLERLTTKAVELPSTMHNNPLFHRMKGHKFLENCDILGLYPEEKGWFDLLKKLNRFGQFPNRVLISRLSCLCSKRSRNFAICHECLLKRLDVKEIRERDTVILMPEEVSEETRIINQLGEEQMMWPATAFVIYILNWQSRNEVECLSMPRSIVLKTRAYKKHFGTRLLLGFDANRIQHRQNLLVYQWAPPLDQFFVLVKGIEYIGIVRVDAVTRTNPTILMDEFEETCARADILVDYRNIEVPAFINECAPNGREKLLRATGQDDDDDDPENKKKKF